MFTSASERAKAASNLFIEVSQKYTHTDAGTLAKYFLGLASEDMKDNSKAEQYLKDVAGSGNKDTAALAKAALAGLYHGEGRDQDAINLYKELIDKPTNTVSKAAAQMDLAQLYETKDPAQAKKIYTEIAANKDTAKEIVNLANTRMAGLK
jgi:tetratricopeptide (TPR) repeat protein